MNVLRQSCLLLLVAGCAPADPPWQPPDGGFDDLRRWWARADDPLLPRLVDAAQRASPTLARAAANIADARAARVASAAALLPALDLAASTSSGRADLAAPAGTAASAALHAGWEIDLFGADPAGAEAAGARRLAAAAIWHDARMSVAGELARSYVDFRACEAHLAQAELDAASRAQTARLIDAAAAGIRAPATAALALALAGAVLTLASTGTALSMPAMIGLIMLMGVTTKNSILLVDYIVIARRACGLDRTAAVLDACRKRSRPVAMTTIAMGAGMLPSALGLGGDPNFRAPMAFVVIGGLVTSTLLSLVVIPVVYAYVDDGVGRIRRLTGWNI